MLIKSGFQKVLTTSSMMFIMGASAAFATGQRPAGSSGFGQVHQWGNDVHGVPEIDASVGLLALAAVGAAVVLAWEVKRRRQA